MMDLTEHIVSKIGAMCIATYNYLWVRVMSVVCQGRFWTNPIGRFPGEREYLYDCSSIPKNLNFPKQRDEVEKKTMKKGTKKK